MAEHLRQFFSNEGVVFSGKAQEKTSVFRIEKRRNPQVGIAIVSIDAPYGGGYEHSHRRERSLFCHLECNGPRSPSQFDREDLDRKRQLSRPLDAR
jgi:hypothetical protein